MRRTWPTGWGLLRQKDKKKNTKFAWIRISSLRDFLQPPLTFCLFSRNIPSDPFCNSVSQRSLYSSTHAVNPPPPRAQCISSVEISGSPRKCNTIPKYNMIYQIKVLIMKYLIYQISSNKSYVYGSVHHLDS